MEANRGDLKAIQQMEPSGPDGGERAELGEPVKDCITDFRANGLVLVLKDGRLHGGLQSMPACAFGRPWLAGAVAGRGCS